MEGGKSALFLKFREFLLIPGKDTASVKGLLSLDWEKPFFPSWRCEPADWEDAALVRAICCLLKST